MSEALAGSDRPDVELDDVLFKVIAGLAKSRPPSLITLMMPSGYFVGTPADTNVLEQAIIAGLKEGATIPDALDDADGPPPFRLRGGRTLELRKAYFTPYGQQHRYNFDQVWVLTDTVTAVAIGSFEPTGPPS